MAASGIVRQYQQRIDHNKKNDPQVRENEQHEGLAPGLDGLAAIYGDEQRGQQQGGSGGGQNHSAEDDFLAFQIANANSGQIRQWANRIEKQQAALRIPAGDPRRYLGEYATPASFERGSQYDVGHRVAYANAPWRKGTDGGNLPLSGKPLVVDGAPYTARGQFDSNSTDIPTEWASQMGAEMTNSRVNQDFQANRQLLAMGRYSMRIRA